MPQRWNLSSDEYRSPIDVSWAIPLNFVNSFVSSRTQRLPGFFPGTMLDSRNLETRISIIVRFIFGLSLVP
jgi:hypothetical protein